MKRAAWFTSIILALLALCGWALAEELENGFYYTVRDGKATVTGCDEATTALRELVIPGTLGGYPVVRIEQQSFAGNTTRESVIIPEGVEEIGWRAFFENSQLSSVELPDSLLSIGSSAFSNCISLKHIKLPDGMTSINSFAFARTPLESIEFPSSITRIDEAAFMETRLEDVVIPEHVYEISDSLFKRCDRLQSVTLHENVTYIGESAFFNCSELNEISLPAKLRGIGAYAFFGCYDLRMVDIPEGIETLEQSVFGGCYRLENVRMPSMLKSIGDSAFSGCKKLLHVVIPDSVTHIGEDVFYKEQYNPTAYPRTNIWVSKNADIYLDPYSWNCTLYATADSLVYEMHAGRDYFKLLDGDELLVFAPEDQWMEPGDVMQVYGDIFPSGNTGTWASSDPDVASIDQKGMISAHAFGTTTITFACGSVSDSFTLTVLRFMTSVDIPKDAYYFQLREGATIQIPCDYLPGDATDVLEWHCSNGAFATVDQNGVVTPADYIKRNLEMGVTIYASSHNRLRDTCYVAYAPPIYFKSGGMAGYDENGDIIDYTHARGGSFELSTQVTTPDGIFGNDYATYTSSDETIASVDETGMVTALKQGRVQLTATSKYDGESVIFYLSVREPVTSITPGVTSVTLGVGDEFIPEFEVLPEDATDKTVILDSNLINVAVVKENDERQYFRIVGRGNDVLKLYSRSDNGVTAGINVSAMEMESVELPESLTRIEQEAFYATSVNRVIVHSGVTVIGARAFADSESLYVVKFADTNVSIDTTAFDGCPKLVFICPKDSAAYNYAKDKRIPCLLSP